MPHIIKTNKLNIYLIKEGFTTYDSITQISNDNTISKINFPGIGNLYYKQSQEYTPDWIDTFFKNSAKIDVDDFTISNAKAVFITSIDYNSTTRFFAIPFGSGRFLLKDNCYDERFGLITTLNILDSKSIRGLDKRTLSTNPKLSREQISIASETTEFGIDADKDLVQSITGKSLDKEFGSTVTGKAALTVNAKVDLSNIKSFLHECYKNYRKRAYKTNFGWIDKIKEIKDNLLIQKLHDKLITEISNANDNILLAVPEIIDWSTVIGFKYSLNSNDTIFSELNMDDFLNSMGAQDVLSLDYLKKSHISCWNVDMDRFSNKWSVYSCLNAELDYNSKKYFLLDSKWFEIDKDFVSKINREFSTIPQSPIIFPDFDDNDADEEEYNVKAANRLRALNLDRVLISYGGGYSKIEFCDILTNRRELIHVKKYSGSATLSHLFSQGHVSAELLLLDQEFRIEVTGKLSRRYRSLIPVIRPTTSDYKIVFAIITDKELVKTPFFSKVSLNYHRRVLEGYGYNVYLDKINNIKTN